MILWTFIFIFFYWESFDPPKNFWPKNFEFILINKLRYCCIFLIFAFPGLISQSKLSMEKWPLWTLRALKMKQFLILRVIFLIKGLKIKSYIWTESKKKNANKFFRRILLNLIKEDSNIYSKKNGLIWKYWISFEGYLGMGLCFLSSSKIFLFIWFFLLWLFLKIIFPFQKNFWSKKKCNFLNLVFINFSFIHQFIK